MKGVIYARYSPGPNQTDQSIEGQLRECKQFAEENNITIVNTYADKKQTGRNDNRVQFQKMLQDSKKKQFDYVIVWKIDRFGRNREEIAKNKAILRMSGVKVLFAKEHIPDGPEGIILESVLEGLAEYYSANLSQNIIRGMRESAMKCKCNGSGLPLGYNVDKEHNYIRNDEEATLIKMIFKMYDDGSKINDICKYLNAHNYKTKRNSKFTHTGVSRILHNRQYIGEYRWKDIITPNGMPRIIDDELFERVAKRLERTKRAPSASRGDVKFLLTGKLFCGYCKSTMIGDSGTGKSGRKFYYYNCRIKKNKHTCKKKTVRKDWLEYEVARITANIVLQDKILDYVSDKVVEIQNKETEDKSNLNYYTVKLKETNSAIKNIMKVIESGIFTESMRERLLKLEDERSTYETEIAKEKIMRPTITKEQVVFFLKQFKNGNIEDKDYQAKLIDIFVNKVILYDDKIIITYNYSGEHNETSAKIIEEAAEELINEQEKCSDKLLSSPPNKNRNSDTFYQDYGSFLFAPIKF